MDQRPFLHIFRDVHIGTEISLKKHVFFHSQVRMADNCAIRKFGSSISGIQFHIMYAM